MTDGKPLFSPRHIQANAKRRAKDHLFLLDNITERLLDKLADINRQFERVAIIGFATDGLKAAFPAAETVDFFEERPDWQAAQLPGELAFIRQDYDLIISASGLHRVNDPVGALIQINRALRPDGLCVLALFAGETLKELRRALLKAEMALSGRASQRVHPFADIRDLGSLLQRAGFALPVADLDLIPVHYRALETLLADIKGMGEGLALTEKPSATPKNLFKALADHYPRTGDHFEASFEIAFITGWHPHESQQKPLQPGSGKVSLADALKPDPKS